MGSKKYSRNRRVVRHLRIRKKVSGTSSSPRLSVFRSNKKIYAQVIDDHQNKTLVSASSIDSNLSSTKDDSRDYTGKCSESYKVGVQIAEKCNKSGISKLVFDRGGYKFHGRVKALAEGVRNGGVYF